MRSEQGFRELAEIDALSNDTHPGISDDGLELFFERLGTNIDIYVSTRATRGDTWSVPTAVTSVNGSTHDREPSLSADGCDLYFASLRAGLGYQTLFVAHR